LSLTLMPQRPPYVRFEQRAEEDRAASITTGGTIMRDIDYVVVQQVGSKDTFEKQADEWLGDIEKQSRDGNYPAEWVTHFRQKFTAYKQGLEAPELGMPIRHWPSVSKAQAENLIGAGCRTVEDLLQRAGMGSRELQNKARAYMSAREGNKAAEQITALQAERENDKTTIQSLETRLANLESQLTSKKRA
jgi:hypothetical protein